MTPPATISLLLLGHGRMGHLVERLAPEYGFRVAGILDSSNNPGGCALIGDRWNDVDVAIDFSTATATVQTQPQLAALGIPSVIGTTGWQAQHEQTLRANAAAANVGVVAASNFSLGTVLFEGLVERAAQLFAPYEDVGAWIHELHHAAKKDAPSGTALVMKAAMERGGFPRPIDVASSRAGAVPGTHTVGFDGPFETVVLTHTTRDRATFARGALVAARWIVGRRGWFSMHDVIFGPEHPGGDA